MIEETTLGDLALLGRVMLNDGYRTRADELGKPGIPILRVAEVQDGYITPSFGDHVRSEFRPKFGLKTSVAEDVVVTTKGTVGRVAMMRSQYPEFVYSPQVCFFRCTDGSGVVPKWLYYWFKSSQFVSQALGIQSQTDMAPYINLADMRTVKITVPSLAEQHAIAGVLGALDDKIESNRRIALNCEQLLSAFAGSARTDVMVPLGSLAQSTRIVVDPSSFGDEVVDHFSIPAFDAGRLPERCRASAIKSGKFSIGKRSILVSRLNPSSPRVWLADSANRPAMCSTEFLVLNPQVGQRMSTIWLAAVSTQFTDEAERRATGTSFSHQRIKPDDALSIEVPDSRLFDEALLVEADDCLERALQARRESASASQLRDALLPELLSGRLRVRDAEEVVEGLDRG